MNWFVGFTLAEGCFQVNILKSENSKSGFRVLLSFILVQHERDEQLMSNIASYLNCGHVYKKKRGSIHFMVTKFSDIAKKLIPLLQNYFTIGEKHKDFQDFCQVSYMIKEKEHLTKNGLEKIKKIKAGMNTGR